MNFAGSNSSHLGGIHGSEFLEIRRLDLCFSVESLSCASVF